MNSDGSLIYLADLEDDAYYEGAIEVPRIGPMLVDGWDNGDRKGIQSICMHLEE